MGKRTKTNNTQQCPDYKQTAINILNIKDSPYGLTMEQANLFIKEFCIEGLHLSENITMKTCYKRVIPKSEELKQYLKKNYPYYFSHLSTKKKDNEH